VRLRLGCLAWLWMDTHFSDLVGVCSAHMLGVYC
jgi:hypothetical protein